MIKPETATSSPPTQQVSAANRRVLEAFAGATPVLVDVLPALEALPGMAENVILTSGAPLAWPDYRGGQRNAILCAAVYEGLARDVHQAAERLAEGRIVVKACHDHACVGSVAGVYTASMPVFVVVNTQKGNRSFCNFYEGESLRRLNYGSYGEDVARSLDNVRDVIAPAVRAAVLKSGGVELKPIMRRALHMGDELHSRNAASTALFARALFPALLEMPQGPGVRELVNVLATNDYFFLRIAMAAAKAIADAGHNVPGSTIVTAMAYSSRDFAIRVSGLGDAWFRGPLPTVSAKFFPGFSADDLEWIGGESIILETVGFGGLAQAAAFPLQEYQGGSAAAMIVMNEEMYQITAGEHPDYKIPFFGYRGIPLGIDVLKIEASGKVPVCDVGLAGKAGGQIGAGSLKPPLDCFRKAAEALRQSVLI